jgi:hypothetical protein
VSTFLEQIKASQGYMHNPRLKWILIIGSTKLMRLTMIVIFNLARAYLQFFQTADEAIQYLHRIRHIDAVTPR